MASGDFVLDEGLDDDEDVVAFHSTRTRTTEGAYTPPPPPSTTLLMELCLNSTRADVNTLLHNARITSLQMRRLPRILRLKVKMEDPESARRAIEEGVAMEFVQEKWDEGFEKEGWDLKQEWEKMGEKVWEWGGKVRDSDVGVEVSRVLGGMDNRWGISGKFRGIGQALGLDGGSAGGGGRYKPRASLQDS